MTETGASDGTGARGDVPVFMRRHVYARTCGCHRPVSLSSDKTGKRHCREDNDTGTGYAAITEWIVPPVHERPAQFQNNIMT